MCLLVSFLASDPTTFSTSASTQALVPSAPDDDKVTLKSYQNKGFNVRGGCGKYDSML